MPKPKNFLDHDDVSVEESNSFGWDMPPSESYAVPIWMDRMGGESVLPDWMRTEDGSCTVDYRGALTMAPPDNYTITLNINEDDGEPVNKEPCLHFIRTGRCKFGEHCYFSHDKKQAENLTKDMPPKKRGWLKEKEIRKSIEQREREAREMKEDEEGKPVVACKFFERDGHCSKGLACPDRHVSLW